MNTRFSRKKRGNSTEIRSNRLKSGNDRRHVCRRRTLKNQDLAGFRVAKAENCRVKGLAPIDTSAWTAETIEDHIREVREVYMHELGISQRAKATL